MPNPQPKLIHPSQVYIEQIDRSTTIYDPYAREPIQQAKRKAVVTCPGQLRMRSIKELEQEFGEGDRTRQRGYVLFRYRDLADRGITLDLNDKIVKIGHLEMSVYIDRLEPVANYQDFNGPTLVKAWFIDRRPGKHN